MSASVEITGKIIEIRDTETVGANNFKKRLLVMETDGEYPQKLPIEFVQDKTSVLDKYSVGDSAIVSVNIRGREYEKDFKTNYFLSLQGWRMVKNGS